MPSAKRAAQQFKPTLRGRAPEPIVLHSAPLVLPMCADPLRGAAVAVRGDRVLQVGPREDLLAYFPVTREHRWPGMIVAGLVDACSAAAPSPPGVTARAGLVADPAEPARLPGVSYVEVSYESEHVWETTGRDAVITAIREVDRPRTVGIAAYTPDPQVLEDVAVLARTFGLRLMADLDRHSPAALDEAGVLGPHCHVTCGRPLDPGERKLLRLRQSVVALCPSPPHPDGSLALLDESDHVALATRPSTGDGPRAGDPGDLLGLARTIRRHAKERGHRTKGLDRKLVEAATLGGARALGMASGPGRVGSLGPGSRADFAVFDARGRYPYAALLSGPRCLATVIGGRITSPG
ncbi:amidohydrolase family protein [Nonomuraea rhizosphaerae]|uniref:amidohydrolase family protein n=1 Tax=Nonomuraea rhizosphaerae TaxID=2665663 RepID=UPI001C5ED318|nr:amidohydrolase family protein [Nonomuraea rhizosphaerae]